MLLKVVLIFITGLVCLFVIGSPIDSLLARFASRRLFSTLVDSEVENDDRGLESETGHLQKKSLIRGPSFILNVLRPMVTTLIVMGGGAILLYYLKISFWGSVLAFAWFFILTRTACLGGRFLRESRQIASISMLIVACLVLSVYYISFASQ
jgi:hypothetical protein